VCPREVRMTRVLAGLAILLSLSSGVATAAPGQPRVPARFDFSAIDRLWAIASALERDEEPAPDAWDALVRTPGYAALIAHERGYGLDFLQRNLRLVFKPSLAADLAKAPRTVALRHFLDLKDRRAALQAFQARVQQSGVERNGLDIARAWIPRASFDRVGVPTVTFIVFARDARGGYGPLIFDLVYACDQGDAFKDLFAHEAFHYYRREQAPYDAGAVPQRYTAVLDALGKIQDEGIADQIDKAAAIEAGREPASTYDRDYRKAMAETPRTLASLDDLLCRLAASPSDASRLGSQMNAAIPMSGHPTGYFMTRAVLAHAGRAEVVRTFNNPFAFFFLYNAAALGDAALPRLSNRAMAALRHVAREVGAPVEPALVRAAVQDGIDTTALHALQEVAGRLAADQEPDAGLWDRLFQSPGMRTYFDHEGDGRERMQDAIGLACKPSRAADLEKALQRGSGTVRYFADYRKEAEAIAREWERWEQSGAFARSLAQAWPYLPPDARETLAGVSLATACLGSADVRFGYELLLVDPLYLRQRSPDVLPALVRLHLLWRYKDAVRPYDPEMITRRQAAFLDTWETIQHRGLWDLMGRELGDPQTAEARTRYDARLKEAAALFRRADAIMARAAARDPSAWREFEGLGRELYVGLGCPLGHFMAAAVKAAFGQEALAATTGHPVAFVQLYQRAARAKGGLPRFSPQSLALLAQLERDAIRRGR